MSDSAVDISKLKSYGTKDIQLSSEDIMSLSECDYIDFKTKWYDYNGDLLYDILCFCNAISASQNRFIVFGIEEDSKTKEKIIHNIEQDPNRKTNEDIEKILNDYFYIKPQIEIETIKIDGKSIDVLKIIPNSAALPYHLFKKFDKKNNKNEKKIKFF